MPTKAIITPSGTEIVELTAEEVAQQVKDAEADVIRVKAMEDKIAKKEADKASGNQKLKDLGLTDDEISALVD